MSNDGLFTATNTWAAVKLNGVDISDGIFTVFSRENNRVGFMKSDTAPTDEVPPAYFSSQKDWIKYPILASEKLYCKTLEDVDQVTFGVVES